MRVGILAAAILGAAVLAAGARPAAAQSDGMEVQRCIWRCLAAARGASNPAYHACAEAQCTDAALGLAPAVAPWAFGVTADGTGMYAGTEDGEGRSLYVICQRQGATYLALFGPEGPDADLTVRVEAQAFTLPFRQDQGGYFALLQPGSPVPAALAAGQVVEVANGIGTVLARLSLAGAGPAITRAFEGCS
jgi:hypothetical protein